jgi:hypothetical protein
VALAKQTGGAGLRFSVVIYLIRILTLNRIQSTVHILMSMGRLAHMAACIRTEVRLRAFAWCLPTISLFYK